MILLGLAAATVAAARQTYTLENDRMRAEIDLASGALVGMQSKLTGWKMLENAAVGGRSRPMSNLPTDVFTSSTNLRRSVPK